MARPTRHRSGVGNVAPVWISRMTSETTRQSTDRLAKLHQEAVEVCDVSLVRGGAVVGRRTRHAKSTELVNGGYRSAHSLPEIDSLKSGGLRRSASCGASGGMVGVRKCQARSLLQLQALAWSTGGAGGSPSEGRAANDETFILLTPCERHRPSGRRDGSGGQSQRVSNG